LICIYFYFEFFFLRGLGQKKPVESALKSPIFWLFLFLFSIFSRDKIPKTPSKKSKTLPAIIFFIDRDFRVVFQVRQRNAEFWREPGSAAFGQNQQSSGWQPAGAARPWKRAAAPRQVQGLQNQAARYLGFYFLRHHLCRKITHHQILKNISTWIELICHFSAEVMIFFVIPRMHRCGFVSFFCDSPPRSDI